MHDPVQITRRLLHKGAKFDFEILEWQGRGGKIIRRENVRHPGAVAILPVLPGGRVVMISNFRAAAGRALLEFPAGTLEAGESPDACAHRELVEETGYRAATLASLGRFYTSPGLSDELMHGYVASDLAEVGQDLQEDEDLTVRIMTAVEAFAHVRAGQIVDGKSILLLHWADREGLIGPRSPASTRA
jgi:ADP-ribose pyrophosphatase